MVVRMLRIDITGKEKADRIVLDLCVLEDTDSLAEYKAVAVDESKKGDLLNKYDISNENFTRRDSGDSAKSCKKPQE